jgi:hypothetical protein
MCILNIWLRYISSLLQCLQETQQPGKNSQGQEGSLQSLYVYQDPVRRHSEPTEEILGRRASFYIGNLSCLSQALAVIHDAETPVQQIPTPPTLEIGHRTTIKINREIHQYLLMTYFRDIHCLYPFLDESLPFLSPDGYVGHDSTELAPWQRFILELVYSIASHHILDFDATDQGGYRYRALADECHRRALQHIDLATADISIITLQAITLLALHSLFAPQRGNFGQLIGLSARLAIDLGTGSKPEPPDQKEVRMQQIYLSIYCLENQFATALDRPCFLPEPVGRSLVSTSTRSLLRSFESFASPVHHEAD